jgi:hypothetical protein
MGTKIKVEYGGGSYDSNLMFSCEYAITLILTYNIPSTLCFVHCSACVQQPQV